jgi:hypothetical protein
MKLHKGIIITPNIEIESVLINSGTIHHSKMNFDKLDFPFRRKAFIPKNDWRKLENEERDILITKEYKYSDFLYIGKLDENIIQLVEKFNIHFLKERNLVFERLKQKPDILESFNEEINKFAEILCTQKNNLEFHRLSVIPSGRYVTSINLNLEEFEYIGLHIDHSTIFSVETSHLSRNRMCINIGNEERYLYVINLTLIQIKMMLGEVMDVNLLNVGNITDYFFQYFPNYPVLRIKQKPYEFYIAPTDNCIHDGSTFKNKYLDITITFLGNFIQNENLN